MCDVSCIVSRVEISDPKSPCLSDAHIVHLYLHRSTFVLAWKIQECVCFSDIVLWSNSKFFIFSHRVYVVPSLSNDKECIKCHHCKEIFQYKDTKWFPLPIEFFDDDNIELLKREESREYVMAIKKKKREMQILQKRLRSYNHDRIINDLIKQIDASPENESSKKYKINVLTVTRQLRNNLDASLKKTIDNFTEYPCLVFGYYEFQYVGLCPLCKNHLSLGWRGHHSLKRGIKLEQRDDDERCIFKCKSCKADIVAEDHIWLCSTDKTYVLLTMCQNCHTEQKYPYKFTAMPLVVMGGGRFTKLKRKSIPEWMFPRSMIYMHSRLFGWEDTQPYTVMKSELATTMFEGSVSYLEKSGNV